jgi:Domain of unknown function (DUF4177)
MKRLTIGLFLACAALVFTGCCAPEHHSKTYEYKIISGRLGGHNTSLPPLEQQLDQAAADGWQVVAATSEDGFPMIILKKQK